MAQLTTFRTAAARISKTANTSDWENDIQDASAGNQITNLSANSTGTAPGVGAQAGFYSGRGGATTGTIVRMFYEFSIPSEAVGNITGITLRIVPYSYGTGDVVVAKSTASPSSNTYSLSDFSSYQSTAYSSVINPNGGSSPTWPTTTGTTDTFDITLNSNAISDANANSVFKIVFMNYTHDFEVSEPNVGTNVFNGLRMIRGTDDTYGTRGRLIVDYFDGYGNNVSGVASANISKITGVATANIEQVSGV